MRRPEGVDPASVAATDGVAGDTVTLGDAALAGGDRLRTLVDLLRDLSRADDPREVLDLFVRGMRRIYGASCYIGLSTVGLPAGSYRVTRLLSYDGDDLVEAAEMQVPARDVEVAGEPPVRAGGFLARIIATPEPKLIHPIRVPTDPVLGETLAPFRSMVAIPIYERGEITGWTLLLRPGEHDFDDAQLETGVLRVNLLASAIGSIKTANQLRAAKAWIDREVDNIAGIQRELLPTRTPNIPGLEIAASYETFDRAGGDYYDFIPLRAGPAGARDISGPWGLLIADAAGHGPSAAVLTAMLHTIIQSPHFTFESPSEALEYLNRRLYARPIGNSFVTAFFGVWDPSKRTLTYSRAGHNPPVLKTRGHGGAVRWLDGAGGLPLGVIDEVGAGEETVALAPDQTLVLYTDGVTEARGRGGRMFGLQGVERALEECSGEPACVIQSLRDALARVQSGRPSDDQTIIAAAVRG